jgi:two-component system chemotaxis sensor kinase CheA
MVSLAQTFTRAAHLAGKLARELGKAVSVELSGRSTLLDKMIVDAVADPIHHILRNAIDHGVEPANLRRLSGKPARAKVQLEARIEGTNAIISISDDGRGIDLNEVYRRAGEIGAISPDQTLGEQEMLRLIFRPGFSTAGAVSAVSGRGVGLDAVERKMHELGGRIKVFSEKGKGTRFELSVPTTLQMISAFIVRSGDCRYALNVGQIVELSYLEPHQVNGSRKIQWQDSLIPLAPLAELLGIEAGGHPKGNGQRVPAFIGSVSEKRIAVTVEKFEGQREIIVKSLGALGRRFAGVAGAVDLEGGDVALVLDLAGLVEATGITL